MEANIRRKINALRQKTVANGATPEESLTAQKKADELERKFNQKPKPTEQTVTVGNYTITVEELEKITGQTVKFFNNLFKRR